MKLKYIMSTEMWIPGAGVCKRDKVIDEENPKRIDRLLRSGMFKEIKTKVETTKPINLIKFKKKIVKIKKSKKKGVDK